MTNSILLFLFLRSFFSRYSSFVVCLLFLVHPINSEAVLYSANLQDVLFFFFGMLSLLLSNPVIIVIEIILLFFLLFCFRCWRREWRIIHRDGYHLLLVFQRKKLKLVSILCGLSFLLYLFLRYGVGKMYLAQVL